jgi:hypothetical protein
MSEIQEWHWADEAKTRVTKSYIKKLGEVHPLTDREHVLVEAAYRRGYVQGFWNCLHFFSNGYSEEKIEHFFSGKLLRWRWKRHNGKVEIAPCIKEKST